MNEPLTIQFFHREDSPAILPEFDLQVKHMSWAAMGGPEQAELQGEISLLMKGLNFPQWAPDMLRKPVLISTGDGQACWWGFVRRIEIAYGGLTCAYDLDELANRTAVLYHRRRPAVDWAGETCLTPWAEDGHSRRSFGRKESILQMGSLLEAEALSARDARLQAAAAPLPAMATRPWTGLLPAQTAQVRLLCSGWFSTLAWVYPEIHLDYEGFVEPAQNAQSLGRTANLDAVLAQSFQTGYGPWLLSEVALDLKVVNACADELALALCSDAGGSPGGVLAQASLPAEAIKGGRWYVHFAFDQPVSIQPGQQYWLKLSRSGGADNDNYYQVFREDSDAYPGGQLKSWNGSQWVSLAGGLADINFYLVGVEPLAGRIEELAGPGLGGQFLNGVHWKTPVSGYTLLWKDSLRTCRDELLDLLQAGSTDGRRLLARVSPQRELEIYVLAKGTPVECLIAADGKLRSLCGRPLGLAEAPAGRRAQVTPGWLDEAVVLERLEWTPEGGLQAGLEGSAA